jgi:AcrR family transcriptional regulator
MPRGRTKGDHNAKRIEIAEAACRVFLRLGLERTSLADIAREIDSSTGVLRHYFSDKDEMLLYAKNLIFDRWFEAADRAAQRHEGLDKIRAILVELLPLKQEAIDGYRLLAMFNGSAIGDARLMKLQDKRNTSHSDQLAEVIVELQKSRVLPKHLNARLEAAGLLALLDGLADQIIVHPNLWSRAQLTMLLNRHIDNLTTAKD